MSFAQLAEGGAFSLFPGVDRIILLVRGGRLRLRVTDAADLPTAHDLGLFEPLHFAGEAKVESSVDGPSMDFNVMTRRRWGSSDVEIRRGPAAMRLLPDADGDRFIVMLQGQADTAMGKRGHVRLDPLDVAGPLGSPLDLRPLGPDTTVAVVTMRANEAAAATSGAAKQHS